MSRTRTQGWSPRSDRNVIETIGAFRRAMVHVLLPASISTEKAAHFLSCSPREVGMLSRKGLIKYLGNPQNNATRYVHTASLFESMADFEWMSRVRQAIYDYNLDRNDRARKRQQFQKGRASQVK